MAVTTQNSVEYAKQVTTPRTKVNSYEIGGKVRLAFFHATQSGAGDVNSLWNLVKLPAGVKRVVGIHLNTSAFGAARTMDIGHTGYTGMDGVAVAASEDAFVAAKDISSAVDAFIRSIGATVSGVDISSKDEVVVQAKVEGDAVDSGETINGWVMYVVE